MTSESRAYFEHRAEQERHAAAHAGDERAARPHREMAELYAQRAASDIFDPQDELPTTSLPNDFRILP
jgi:hypothetical protein